MTAYHGTTLDKASKILQGGLKPKSWITPYQVIAEQYGDVILEIDIECDDYPHIVSYHHIPANKITKQQKAPPMSNPSEKAMKTPEQWATDYYNQVSQAIFKGTKHDLSIIIKQAQAEALSEHKRVLDECERALRKLVDGCNELATQVMALQGEPHSFELSRNMLSCQSLGRQALAAIAELKTNEKLV